MKMNSNSQGNALVEVVGIKNYSARTVQLGLELYLMCTFEQTFSAFPTCEPLTQFSCSNGRCVSVQWHCDSGEGINLLKILYEIRVCS